MIREEPRVATDNVPKLVDESPTPHSTVRRPDALATQEELDGLDELIAAFEKEIGPVPPEIREQFYADLAAADAKIGRIR